MSVAYSRKERNSNQVCLNLNGNKFNQNHKASQFSYWSGFSKGWEGHDMDEAEERIWSDHPTIRMSNPGDWIDSVHMKFQHSESESWERQKPFFDLQKVCSTYRIPWFAYGDQTDFMRQTHPTSSWDDGQVGRDRDYRGVDNLRFLHALEVIAKTGEVPDSLKMHQREIPQKESLFADIHNYYKNKTRDSVDSPYQRDVMQSYFAAMKRVGIRDPKEFYSWLHNNLAR